MYLGLNDHLCKCSIGKHMLRHEWQDKNSVESENITQHLKDTHVEGRLEL